jgi:hypothetical protein
VVALLDRRASGAFSGNLFVVADTMEVDTDGGRLVVTDFDVVAVELTGTAAWVGADARLALGKTPSGLPGVSQPGRCCDPTTICIPGGPEPDPIDPRIDPIFRFSLGGRMAVVRAPSEPRPFGPLSVDPGREGLDILPGRGGAIDDISGQPPMSRVGDYRTRQDEGRSPVRALLLDTYSLGNKAVPDGLRWPDGVPGPQILDCVRVVDKFCTVVTPICEPGMTGFTDAGDGDVMIAVGSNPCGGAAGSRPIHLREVPEWCKYIFTPMTTPLALPIRQPPSANSKANERHLQFIAEEAKTPRKNASLSSVAQQRVELRRNDAHTLAGGRQGLIEVDRSPRRFLSHGRRRERLQQLGLLGADQGAQLVGERRLRCRNEVAAAYGESDPGRPDLGEDIAAYQNTSPSAAGGAMPPSSGGLGGRGPPSPSSSKGHPWTLVDSS